MKTYETHVAQEWGVQGWVERSHGMAVEKGWWPDEPTKEQKESERTLAMIAVLHCILSEVVERARRGEDGADEYMKRIADGAALLRSATSDDETDRLVDLFLSVPTMSDETVSDLSKMALIHTEVSEAVQCIVTGDLKSTPGENRKPEGAVVELADVFIRICDWCGRKGLNLGAAVVAKFHYNASRPHRHGGKLA